jgi:DNA-binding PadR family transcriptional regulator
MILQPRDRKIMAALHAFRMLSREQIASLFGFRSTRRVNSRLRKLYDHGYLSRSFQPTIRGSAKAIYYLGPKGAGVAARELGIELKAIRRQRKHTSELRELFLAHTMELNDVRISVSRAIRNHPETKLERWISDTDCAQEYRVASLGKDAVRRFRPDGYFRFWHQGKLHPFFLEHDRSTMTLGRFAGKVQMYLEFARLDYYRERFGVKHFQVLVIVPTRTRLKNLKQAVEKVIDQLFWFTTLEQVTQETVLGPIWQRAGAEGLFPLIAL